ncbi:hypothetical protein [Aeromonas salmonicida]|uniref:hypothetical protein n=1 Tax=Aeromonas salmonicida TaxID=645 RepID=UPI0012D9F740|nr:hypothetical protein [Aeromonas salmonicida]MUG28733.1 hypothetical protein [Aeromonas salmonicida]HEH9407661.1 hypothetical protein [Aeromonas salmonicida]
MQINKIAFGNKSEAFIEDRFINGVNIIFSDDNNRGKTLVMQGLMFSLGYDAIFPSSFDYKNYYFYSEVIIDNSTYHFLRKKNTISIRNEDSIQIFNSVSEARYFLDRFVFKIPRVIKDSRSTLVDLSLLYELFFVGQDNRSPSGLISKGQFNKIDFKNMVYDLAKIQNRDTNSEETADIKKDITTLQIKLTETKKKLEIIKENPRIAEVTSKLYDSEVVQRKAKAISEINNTISNLRRTRQREINRKSKLDNLVSELNSLNRELNVGRIQCGECGSDKIIYSNNDMMFEVSNVDVRNEILKSIHKNIELKYEIIDDISREINLQQDMLDKELTETPPDFQQIILYHEQITNQKDYDEEAFDIARQIKNLKASFASSNLIDDSIKQAKNDFDVALFTEMNSLYKSIDPNGNLIFDDIFTTKNSTFSGSEGQEFYFCKLVALSNQLKHDFPIIVDSFREGELSTIKEEKMLAIYKNLNKQIILTSTLKNEEYEKSKYNRIDKINSIDYSEHQDCKILSNKVTSDFVNLISGFNGLML